MKLFLSKSVICTFNMHMEAVVSCIISVPFKETLGQDCEKSERNMFIAFGKGGQKYFIEAFQILFCSLLLF